MNDDLILQRGGDESDIKEYAKNNGAVLTKCDIEIDRVVRDIIFRVFAVAETVTPIYSGRDCRVREIGGEEMRSIIVQELNKELKDYKI